MLLASSDAGSDERAARAHVLLFDDGGRTTAAFEWTDPAPTPHALSLAGVAWNDARHRFELFLDTHDAALGIRVLPLRPEADTFDGEEALALDAAKLDPWAYHARVVAGFASDPPSALLLRDTDGPPSLFVARAGELERIAVAEGECAPSDLEEQRGCVAVATSASFETPRFGVWIDGRGATLQAHPGDATQSALVEHALPAGGAEPLVAERLPSGGVVTPGGVELATVSRGGEGVLFARHEGGERWTPVSRVTPLAAVRQVVAGGAALLVLTEDGRGVVLDRGLAVVGGASAKASVMRIVAQRLAASPFGTAAYFACFVAFVLLLPSSARALRRGEAPRRLVATLVVYVVAAGAFLVLARGEIFPP
jgi:hypothetical protein